MSFVGFFRKAAPWLAAGAQYVPVAGPAIAATINSIASKNGVTLPAPADHAIPESLENAVAALTGNSQAMLDLKKADNDFALQMQAANFKQISDLETLGNADLANARNREIQVKDHVPAILAFVITAGFFVTLWWVFMHGVQEQVRDIADAMVGTLGTAWVGVVTYYFGSSRGSDDKTKVIADLAKQ